MKLPHKALIIFSLLLCAAMALLQSCTPQQKAAMHEKRLAAWCAQCPSKDSVITEIKQSIIERIDTSVIQIPADSAWYYALIECIQDSSKKFIPVIVNSEKSQGKRVKVNVSLNEGKLKLDCDVLKDSVEILTKSVHRSDSLLQSAKKTIFVPTYIEKKLTWWQQFKIEYGGYALGIIGLFLLYLLIRLGWFIFKLTPYGAAFNVPSVLSRFVR